MQRGFWFHSVVTFPAKDAFLLRRWIVGDLFAYAIRCTGCILFHAALFSLKRCILLDTKTALFSGRIHLQQGCTDLQRLKRVGQYIRGISRILFDLASGSYMTCSILEQIPNGALIYDWKMQVRHHIRQPIRIFSDSTVGSSTDLLGPKVLAWYDAFVDELRLSGSLPYSRLLNDMPWS